MSLERMKDIRTSYRFCRAITSMPFFSGTVFLDVIPATGYWSAGGICALDDGDGRLGGFQFVEAIDSSRRAPMYAYKLSMAHVSKLGALSGQGEF